MMTEPTTRPSDAGLSDGEAVALGRLQSLAGYHLRRASSAFATDFSRALDGTGMRQVLLGILSVIDANPGISQGQAGKALGIQRANMVALINDLVDRDLIARRLSRHDRRAFELAITSKGTELLADCLERIAAHEARMLAGFSHAERAMLIELLTRIEAHDGI